MRIVALAFALIVAGCTPAQAPQAPAQVTVDPAQSAMAIERGRRIAQDWCARCHIVTAQQRRVENPAAGAPRFVDVAHRWAASPGELRRFMDDLHLPMPTFRLWPAERDDVVAYLISLDQDAPRPQR